METTSNKTIIAGFYREVVRHGKSELIPQYIHENYIQHSPMGKDGQQGLFEMVTFLKKLPPPPENEPSPIKHLIEQDNLVVAHLELHFMGKHVKVIEMFRMENGRAAEHWDVTEEQNSETQPFLKTNKDVMINDRLLFVTDLYAGNAVKIHRIISEGDLTAVHAEAEFEGRSIALFDIFQFEDDRLADYWGVKQFVPEKMTHNNGMF